MFLIVQSSWIFRSCFQFQLSADKNFKLQKGLPSFIKYVHLKTVISTESYLNKHCCIYPFKQAFNKYKREGFCLQNVDKAPLAKRRKMKKTSTSTETRSSSSESSHSSHSHGKTTPTKTLQPTNPTDSNNPEGIFQFFD